MNSRGNYRGSTRLSLAVALAAFCLLFSGGSANQDLESRRNQVAQMTPAEKAQLLRQWERFKALPSDERKNLKELERQISSDSTCEELKAVMRRYYDWCRTLPAYQRLELQELPAKERIKKIRNLKQQSEDVEGLKKWFDKKAEQIVANLSEDNRKDLLKYGPFAKHFLLGRWMHNMADKSGKTKENPLTDRDLADLRSHLSESTRKVMEEMSTQEQWKAIVKRTRQHFQAQGRRHRMGRKPGMRPEGMSTEDLAVTFQNLSPDRQDALLSLPAEEMLQQLQQIHIANRIRSRPPPPSNRLKRFPPGKKRPR